MSSDKTLVRQIANQLLIDDRFYIQQLLNIFAIIADSPGIAYADVNDRTTVGDQFLCCYENDFRRMDQLIDYIKVYTGISVKFNDTIISVANKLKN